VYELFGLFYQVADDDAFLAAIRGEKRPIDGRVASNEGREVNDSRDIG
jgi:hypothetical protein